MIPHLRKQGTATQLIVREKPLLVLGGELGNSSASDPAYIEAIWPKVMAFNMNTVLAPVYWELLEPEEGQFDFTLVDSLIHGARRHDVSLVLLWFGAWKNSMSCYAPLWAKRDLDRFPRMVDTRGVGQEILSAFSESVLDADSRAFAALMRRLREIDGEQNTVVMVQVENEIGMLPCARDMSETANQLYAGPVPDALLSYLDTHSETLVERLRSQWEAAGRRMAGTWEEVFGPGDATEEIFMAWHYAVFTGRLAAAGKTEYPLPMYVNAALNRPGHRPGQYPSAGPLPHLLDIWKAGAPTIDFLSPDLYFPEYDEWISKYPRPDNPLFVPENQLGHFNGAHAVHTIGAYDAIGYSPFSVESCPDPAATPLASSYRALSALASIILENQGKGLITGVLLTTTKSCADRVLGGYRLHFRHEKDWEWSRPAEPIPPDRMIVGCLVISTGPDEFIVMGSSVLITFEPAGPGLPVAGFATIDEILVEGEEMRVGRRLNGDQSHQGRHVHLPDGEFGIQRVTLYRYQ
ncbi:MAG: DUF5597 domain-containing protein [Anaerolineae bacterium]|nr:DUF5597 domain-containing protein [Anaerolineae bacterium]